MGQLVIIVESDISGVWRITLEARGDERGYFARTFCRREFAARGLPSDLVQCNVSFNPRSGTLRGMHLQLEPHAESKLIRCTRGSVFDVAVDLRPDSPTFARWTGLTLSATNGAMLLISKGFAHGYLTLEDHTEVFYQVTEEYHPQSEAGVHWNDPTIRIAWPFQPTCISEKDRTLPDVETLRSRLVDTTTKRR